MRKRLEVSVRFAAEIPAMNIGRARYLRELIENFIQRIIPVSFGDWGAEVVIRDMQVDIADAFRPGPVLCCRCDMPLDSGACKNRRCVAFVED